MKMALFCSTLSNESRRDYIKHTYPNIIDLDSQEDEEETPPQPETIFRIRPLNPELLERKRKERAEREQATKNTFDSLFYIQM